MDASAWIRRLTFPWAAATVRRHIGSIRGLEHLPDEGSFILAPNHTSYFDHFLTITLVELTRGVPLWIFAKKELFDRPVSRIWNEAWYSIPVDRQHPGPSVIRAVNAVFADGDALGIYPEGTRGPGDQLLPFKAGAFELALRREVPIIPLAIRGANTVLPPGSLRLQRGRVDISFDQPLLPERRLDKTDQSADLARRTRQAIEALLASPPASASGAEVINYLVALHLDEHGRLPSVWINRLRRLTHLYLQTAKNDGPLQTQLSRLDSYALIPRP